MIKRSQIMNWQSESPKQEDSGTQNLQKRKTERTWRWGRKKVQIKNSTRHWPIMTDSDLDSDIATKDPSSHRVVPVWKRIDSSYSFRHCFLRELESEHEFWSNIRDVGSLGLGGQQSAPRPLCPWMLWKRSLFSYPPQLINHGTASNVCRCLSFFQMQIPIKSLSVSPSSNASQRREPITSYLSLYSRLAGFYPVSRCSLVPKCILVRVFVSS